MNPNILLSFVILLVLVFVAKFTKDYQKYKDEFLYDEYGMWKCLSCGFSNVGPHTDCYGCGFIRDNQR